MVEPIAFKEEWDACVWLRRVIDWILDVITVTCLKTALLLSVCLAFSLSWDSSKLCQHSLISSRHDCHNPSMPLPLQDMRVVSATCIHSWQLLFSVSVTVNLALVGHFVTSCYGHSVMGGDRFQSSPISCESSSVPRVWRPTCWHAIIRTWLSALPGRRWDVTNTVLHIYNYLGMQVHDKLFQSIGNPDYL